MFAFFAPAEEAMAADLLAAATQIRSAFDVMLWYCYQTLPITLRIH